MKLDIDFGVIENIIFRQDLKTEVKSLLICCVTVVANHEHKGLGLNTWRPSVFEPLITIYDSQGPCYLFKLEIEKGTLDILSSLEK